MVDSFTGQKIWNVTVGSCKVCGAKGYDSQGDICECKKIMRKMSVLCEEGFSYNQVYDFYINKNKLDISENKKKEILDMLNKFGSSLSEKSMCWVVVSGMLEKSCIYILDKLMGMEFFVDFVVNRFDKVDCIVLIISDSGSENHVRDCVSIIKKARDAGVSIILFLESKFILERNIDLALAVKYNGINFGNDVMSLTIE